MVPTKIALAALVVFSILTSPAGAYDTGREDRSLPFSDSARINAFGITVGYAYEVRHDGDDVVHCVEFSAPVASSKRCVNVTAGVNPAQGKCWQVMTEIPIFMPPLKSIWAESCSSGLGHCREGNLWVSTSLILKAGFHVGSTQNYTAVSNKWYRTKHRC